MKEEYKNTCKDMPIFSLLNDIQILTLLQSKGKLKIALDELESRN